MIVVYGLGRLGYVTAACMAYWGHNVVAVDTTCVPIPDEPDLQDLIGHGDKTDRLQIIAYSEGKIPTSEVLWITIDTPVSSDGEADVTELRATIERVLHQARVGTLVLISSQVPVGFSTDLQQHHPSLDIVSVPENLRRGSAITNFLDPDRIVVGHGEHSNIERIVDVFGPVSGKIFWTTRETAEFSKHALNTYLGISIVFANEMARLCQLTASNYADVEKLLRLDRRIGEHAYVKEGLPDARHFLRDMRYLLAIDKQSAFLSNGIAQLLA